jgi:hypothetical protein
MEGPLEGVNSLAAATVSVLVPVEVVRTLYLRVTAPVKLAKVPPEWTKLTAGCTTATFALGLRFAVSDWEAETEFPKAEREAMSNRQRLSNGDESVFMGPDLFEFSHPSAEECPDISPRRKSEYSPPPGKEEA